MSDNRSIKTERVTIFNQATTTEIKVTTSVLGEAFSTIGYHTGYFVTSVIANSANAHKVYLDVRVDTTNWIQYATLHPDMTTTANAVGVNVANFPNTVRVRIPTLTTTSKMRLNVKAELYAK